MRNPVVTSPQIGLPSVEKIKGVESVQVIETDSSIEVLISSKDPTLKRNPAMRAGFEIERFLEAQRVKLACKILIDGVVY